MANKGPIERKQLSIISVVSETVWGDKKLPVMRFKASDGKKDYTYEIFANSALIQVVKDSVGKTLECDVETSEREKDGDVFTDRKVKQVYVDGNPVGNKGRGGTWSKSPEERRSIERQSCLNCACMISPGGSLLEDVFKTAEKMFEWVNLGNVPAVASVPVTSDPVKRSEPIAKSQLDALENAAIKYGWNVRDAILKHNWAAKSSSELSKSEAAEILKEFNSWLKK